MDHPRLSRLLSIHTILWAVALVFIGANMYVITFDGNRRNSFTNDTSVFHKDVLGTSLPERPPNNSSLTNKYVYWQKIVSERPDYRDGHFMLAVLAFHLNNHDEANRHLLRVKELDPNFIGIAKLEPFLTAEK